MKRIQTLLAVVIFLFFLCLYIGLQSQSIFGGDAGDLVTAAFTGGIAHPPGYPLYTALGYFLSHSISIGSVAWRMNFLSSIPFAFALTILFLYISTVSGSTIASIVAVMTLGTSYIYWLYAIVPEVFGLHILFVVMQLGLLLGWIKTHNTWFGLGWIAAFVLSLSHHHIILFMVPAYGYLLSKDLSHVKPFIRKNRNVIIITVLACLLPIVWYVYSIPRLAAYTWEDTLTLHNVIKIISRATYGSFASANIVVDKPLSRLTDVYAYFTFLIEDFTIPAIFLACVGGVYEFIKKRSQFVFHFIAFACTGPLFFFYAGYILTNSFTIATFERFVMSSYVFIAVWIGFGVVALMNGINILVQSIRVQTGTSSALSYKPMIFALCMIIPLNLLFINYPKMAILKNDTTAEHVGMNILDSADKHGILLISRDNEIFNTSYMNIAMGYRSDLIVINKSHLLDARRFKNIAFRHPDILLPDRKSSTFSDEFVLENVKKRPLYTNDPFPLPEGYVWIREGLLHKLFKKDELPPYQDILDINNRLWKSYHDPLRGSLSSYKHLMLASNLIQYRMHSSETGDYFLVAGDYINAERYYRAALRYDSNDAKVWQQLAVSVMEQKKCDQAKEILTETQKGFPTSEDTPLLFIKLYTECQKDEFKAKEWKSAYDVLIKKSQKKLQ